MCETLHYMVNVQEAQAWNDNVMLYLMPSLIPISMLQHVIELTHALADFHEHTIIRKVADHMTSSLQTGKMLGELVEWLEKGMLTESIPWNVSIK